MNIRIKANQIELTVAIEEYVEKKIRPLEKLIESSDDIICEIELARTTRHHKSGEIFKAEINMLLKGFHLYVVSEKEDLYQAIDEIRDQADEMIANQKDKKETIWRKGAQKIKDSIKRLRRA